MRQETQFDEGGPAQTIAGFRGTTQVRATESHSALKCDGNGKIAITRNSVGIVDWEDSSVSREGTQFVHFTVNDRKVCVNFPVEKLAAV